MSIFLSLGLPRLSHHTAVEDLKLIRLQLSAVVCIEECKEAPGDVLGDNNFVTLTVGLILVKVLDQVKILLVIEELVMGHLGLHDIHFLKEVLEGNELLYCDTWVIFAKLTTDFLDLSLVLLDEVPGD